MQNSALILQLVESARAKLSPDEFQAIRDHFVKPSNQEQKTNLRSNFTPEEDDLLRSLVAQYGSANWASIAAHMPNRTLRQCRERWRHYLAPNIKNLPWTPAEDTLLLKKVQELGPKWVEISKHFANRTDFNVKNRWLVLVRRQASQSSSNNSCSTSDSEINSPLASEPEVDQTIELRKLPVSPLSTSIFETAFTETFDDIDGGV